MYPCQYYGGFMPLCCNPCGMKKPGLNWNPEKNKECDCECGGMDDVCTCTKEVSIDRPKKRPRETSENKEQQEDTQLPVKKSSSKGIHTETKKPRDTWIEKPGELQSDDSDWIDNEDALNEDSDEDELFTSSSPRSEQQDIFIPDINVFVHPMYGGLPGIQRATQVSQAHSGVSNQTPHGIDWIWQSTWDAAEWDRMTTIDLETMSTAQACSWLWPDGPDILRGTKEAWDDWVADGGGFLEPDNPTANEIAQWTRRYILHFRFLTNNSTPLEIDQCLMIRALWSDERQYTNTWDTKYPGTCGTAWGPCWECGGNGGGHCGESFVPTDSEDQAPYLTNGGTNIGVCTFQSGAAGISSTANTDIPWSIKISRVMNQWFCSKDGGHFGPFMGRERFGFHWLVFGAGMTFRGKWAGALHSVQVPNDW